MQDSAVGSLTKRKVIPYNASLTLPSAPIAEAVAGRRKSASPVEENAVVLKESSRMKFNVCAQDPEATEKLAPNMMLRSER